MSDYDEDWDDDDEWYDEMEDWEPYSACMYQYKDGSYCGQKTIGEGCEECGMPLCPMHMETGANFCNRCPTKDYRPAYY